MAAKTPKNRPNAVRLRLVELTTQPANDSSLETDEVMVLRTNIDDVSGELLGADFIQAALLAGAKDVTITPCIMKQGRPGQVLELLCAPADTEKLASWVLSNTSAIGLRTDRQKRLMLPREAVSLDTSYGTVAAKKVTLPDGSTRITPEYASCTDIAAAANVPVQDIYRAAIAAGEHSA